MNLTTLNEVQLAELAARPGEHQTAAQGEMARRRLESLRRYWRGRGCHDIQSLMTGELADACEAGVITITQREAELQRRRAAALAARLPRSQVRRLDASDTGITTVTQEKI